MPYTVLACEPILPLTMLFMPWTNALRAGFLALALVVAVKCGAFAILQRGAMSASFAATAMFVANIVSTLAGFFAAMAFVAPSALGVGLLLALMISIFPARRLSDNIPRLSMVAVLVLMAVLYIGSVVLFMFAQKMALDGNLLAYWAIKYAYIVCALLISMTLTTFWEEYVVWRMAGHEKHTFLTPVFRANAIALFLVMLVSAIAVLPQRLRSPDFLIALLFH